MTEPQQPEEIRLSKTDIPRVLFLETVPSQRETDTASTQDVDESGKTRRRSPDERGILWETLSALIDAVNANGIASLDHDQFCRYTLLLPLFKVGYVFVDAYRGIVTTRRGHAPEVTQAFDNACYFIMRPTGIHLEYDGLYDSAPDSVRAAGEAARQARITGTTQPDAHEPPAPTPQDKDTK